MGCERGLEGARGQLGDAAVDGYGVPEEWGEHRVVEPWAPPPFQLGRGRRRFSPRRLAKSPRGFD